MRGQDRLSDRRTKKSLSFLNTHQVTTRRLGLLWSVSNFSKPSSIRKCTCEDKLECFAVLSTFLDCPPVWKHFCFISIWLSIFIQGVMIQLHSNWLYRRSVTRLVGWTWKGVEIDISRRNFIAGTNGQRELRELLIKIKL